MSCSVHHVLMMVTLIALGCRSEGRSTAVDDTAAPLVPADDDISDPGSVLARQALSGLCQSTNGRWHDALKACHCSEGSVFSVRSGCRSIDLDVTFESARIRFPGTLLFSLAPDLAAMGVSLERNQVDTSILIGYQFDEADSEGLADVEVAVMSPIKLDATLDELLTSPESVAPTTHGLLEQSRGYLTFDDLQTRCATLAGSRQDQYVKAWDEFCAAAAYAIHSVQRDRLPVMTWHSKQLGLGRKALYYELGEFSAYGADIIYKVIGKKNTPINRKISVASATGIVGEFALSPTGELFGGRISYSTVEVPDSPTLYQAHRAYFVGAFINLAEEVASRGDRARLRRSLWETSFLKPVMDDVDLPHESSVPVRGEVRAMILEGDVDLRIPALARRFVLDEPIVDKFVATGALERSVFADESLPGVLGSMTAAPANNHGTNVAGVLLADLPDARAFLVDVNTRVPRNSARFREMLDVRIGSRQPHVVNISRSFHGTIGACEEVFDPLFFKYRDVLFIVAAGNYGEKDSPEICPASLAWKHQNVLSVAGTDENGDIHRRSNWGSKGANMTAPYCARTVDPLDDDSDQPRAVEACGTSISAPLVGNAALKLFAGKPGLAAIEVARFLKLSSSWVEDVRE